MISLICLLVPDASAPDPETIEKLLAAAEKPHPRGVDNLAHRILCQLRGNIGETLREKSPVCGYGHPVDSGLVNMLDTPMINGAFRALVDFNADTAMGQMLAAGVPVPWVLRSIRQTESEHLSLRFLQTMGEDLEPALLTILSGPPEVGGGLAAPAAGLLPEWPGNGGQAAEQCGAAVPDHGPALKPGPLQNPGPVVHSEKMEKGWTCMSKKILAVLLTAVLLCGMLTACGGKENSSEEPVKDTEYDEYIELILTDWMRCISASEAMYEDLDWALSYIAAFGEQPEWNTLLSARAAIELTAKRIALREKPAWDAPEAAYDYFMDREIDVSFVQPELESFEFNRQSLLQTCNLLRQDLMYDVFTRDGLPRTVHTAEIEAEYSRASLEFMAYDTDYLLLELGDAEWTEKVHKSMGEYSPRIEAARNPSLTTEEELKKAASAALDALEAAEAELTSVVGRSQAELDLLREYIAQGDDAAAIAMFSTIEGLPGLLPNPGWDLTEGLYYWKDEDGTRRYLTKKEDLTGPPEHCVLTFSNTTEDEVVEYIYFLHEVLGLDGNRVDGENGCYDVYFQVGDSSLVVSWTEEGAVIYMLETLACLVPDWLITASQT